MNRQSTLTFLSWRCAFPVLTILAALSVTSSLGAQVAGSIAGFVRDPSGAAVPDATITAVLTGQQLARTANPDATGYYNLLSILPGEYRITVTSPGFETQVQNEVRLTSGQNLRLDVVLTIGSVQSEVTVTSTATLVDTTNQTLSDLVP